MPKNLIFVLLLFLLVSCSADDEAQDVQQDTPEPVESYRYLALGDSYTIGQGVSEASRWPNQLTAQLVLNGIDVEETKIIAQTGWRVNQLLSAIEQENPEGFNLVSLLIGVNNQFGSQFNGQTVEDFKPQFDVVLNKAIDLSGPDGHVFVVSIPDYGVTPFGSSNSEEIAEELDQYNTYIKSKCEELNIPFINITDISRNLGDSEGALASDNLHPSGFQYSLWVDEILPVVIGLLSE